MYKKGRGRMAAKKAEEKDDGSPKVSAATLRMQADMEGIDIPEGTCKLELLDPKTLLEFNVTVRPDSGYWKGGKYTFNVKIPKEYPHKTPDVTLQDKIYHPNIDLQGKICVSTVGKGKWKPTNTTQQVVFALIFLLAEPNPTDPLNPDAAQVLREDKKKFASNVTRAMQGMSVNGEQFPANPGLQK